MGIRTPTFASAALALALLAGIADAHTSVPRFRREARNPVPVIRLGKPHPAPTIAVIEGRTHGVLDLNVKPRATEIWIDGDFHGTCDAFDGFPAKLTLPPGLYRLRLVTPDGLDVGRDLRVLPGLEVNVGLDLR